MAYSFSVVTAEGIVTEVDDITSVTIPTADGEITVLPHHIPLVAPLVDGVLTVREGESEQHLAVDGGFVNVTPTGVTILADTAERAEEIDAAKAEAARKQAEEVMAGKVTDQDLTEAAASLRRNLARLRAAELVQARRGGKRHG